MWNYNTRNDKLLSARCVTLSQTGISIWSGTWNQPTSPNMTRSATYVITKPMQAINWLDIWRHTLSRKRWKKTKSATNVTSLLLPSAIWKIMWKESMEKIIRNSGASYVNTQQMFLMISRDTCAKTFTCPQKICHVIKRLETTNVSSRHFPPLTNSTSRKGLRPPAGCRVDMDVSVVIALSLRLSRAPASNRGRIYLWSRTPAGRRTAASRAAIMLQVGATELEVIYRARLQFVWPYRYNPSVETNTGKKKHDYRFNLKNSGPTVLVLVPFCEKFRRYYYGNRKRHGHMAWRGRALLHFQVWYCLWNK